MPVVAAKGVVLKSGGRLKQDLGKDLKTIYAYIHAVLKLSYSAFQYVTSCNRTNFCTNFSPKKVGDAVHPVEKSGDAVPPRPRPTTPLVSTQFRSLYSRRVEAGEEREGGECGCEHGDQQEREVEQRVEQNGECRPRQLNDHHDASGQH